MLIALITSFALWYQLFHGRRNGFHFLSLVISEKRHVLTSRRSPSKMKENTEYLRLFIIVDDTKFQQGQENVLFS